MPTNVKKLNFRQLKELIDSPVSFQKIISRTNIRYNLIKLFNSKTQSKSGGVTITTPNEEIDACLNMIEGAANTIKIVVSEKHQVKPHQQKTGLQLVEWNRRVDEVKKKLIVLITDTDYTIDGDGDREILNMILEDGLTGSGMPFNHTNLENYIINTKSKATTYENTILSVQSYIMAKHKIAALPEENDSSMVELV